MENIPNRILREKKIQLDDFVTPYGTYIVIEISTNNKNIVKVVAISNGVKKYLISKLGTFEKKVCGQKDQKSQGQSRKGPAHKITLHLDRL